jgi:hypothetical protein
VRRKNESLVKRVLGELVRSLFSFLSAISQPFDKLFIRKNKKIKK